MNPGKLPTRTRITRNAIAVSMIQRQPGGSPYAVEAIVRCELRHLEAEQARYDAREARR